mmetsp:Transcript_45077/g.104428  ORF Transcript_45077/g.104428 Transcript_45077/m.104428 type:complete len:629 (+) Transcript_45077:234-2120(+)
MLSFDIDATLNFGIQALYVLRTELTAGLIFAVLFIVTRTAGIWAGSAEKTTTRKTASTKPTPSRSIAKPAFGELPKGLGPCTPAELAAEVAMLCRVQPTKAIERYRAEVERGLNISDMPTSTCLQLMTELVLAAVRSNLPEKAVELVHDLRRHGPTPTSAMLASVVKMCASKRCFPTGLRCYDLLSKEIPMDDIDKSVWSCLLFCALEVKTYTRCWFFFDRVKASGPPSAKDLGNMVRAAAAGGNMRQALDLFAEMRKLGHDIDSFVCNTLVAALVQEDWVEQAAALVKDTPDVTDPITYNTLMKGFSRAQSMDRCFEVFEDMRAKGIEPSQVTYGILLDGCVNLDMTDKAADIFEMMKQENCPMNVVLYTTLMKGFARAGKLDQAMKVYEQMKEAELLDVITFSILIKASCDAGRLEAGLELLEEMVQLNFSPDEVVFNNLLSGCANVGNISLGKRLYADLLKLDLKPSTATFSILLRLYAKCKLYDEAIALLKTEPLLHGVEVEERLYVQLFQTFARERQGRRCVEVFSLMCELGRYPPPSAFVVGTLLKTCVKLNMYQTAVEILELAAARGLKVQALEANSVLEGSLRKKKASWARACLNSMVRLGVTPDAALAHQAQSMVDVGH